MVSICNVHLKKMYLSEDL